MKKINTVATLALLNVALLGCSDKGALKEQHEISTDIKVVHDGLVRYHQFNKEENCPSVATLIDKGFVNDKPNEYGTLTRATSLYQIKDVSEEVCEVVVKMGEQVICSEYEFELPESTHLSCEQKNTLRLFVNVKAN